MKPVTSAPILIALRDGGVREVLVDALREAGIAVDTADTTRAAAALLARGRYRIVFLDLFLGDGMTSHGLLARFERGSLKRPDCVIVAGSTSTSLPSSGEQVDIFVRKPFEIHTVATMLRDVLQRLEHGATVSDGVIEERRTSRIRRLFGSLFG